MDILNKFLVFSSMGSLLKFSFIFALTKSRFYTSGFTGLPQTKEPFCKTVRAPLVFPLVWRARPIPLFSSAAVRLTAAPPWLAQKTTPHATTTHCSNMSFIPTTLKFIVQTNKCSPNKSRIC